MTAATVGFGPVENDTVKGLASVDVAGVDQEVSVSQTVRTIFKCICLGIRMAPSMFGTV